MDELRTRVRTLRIAQQMSKRELARAAGLTPTYVLKIEDGSLPTPPSADAIVSLARALEADEVELLAAAGLTPNPFLHSPNVARRNLSW
jgi:transcriptional regulator with XRE-family HTH domain